MIGLIEGAITVVGGKIEVLVGDELIVRLGCGSLLTRKILVLFERITDKTKIGKV